MMATHKMVQRIVVMLGFLITTNLVISGLIRSIPFAFLGWVITFTNTMIQWKVSRDYFISYLEKLEKEKIK